jgi:hypothetical protein
MKHIKIVGICLAAVFAMGMVAAGSASAETEPYIEQCLQTLTAGQGNWLDSQCSVSRASGNWIRVIEPGIGNCFRVVEPGTGAWNDNRCSESGGSKEFIRVTGAAGGEAATFSSIVSSGELETEKGHKVKCAAGTDSGEITGAKTVGNVIVIFTGCESEVLETKVKCKTTGAKEGEIRTNNLKGEIGYLNKTEQKVGLLLEPSGTELFAEFKCSTLTAKVKGAIIGEFTKPKTGEMSTEAKLSYAQEKGKQKWTKLEGGTERKLETNLGAGYEGSGIKNEDTLTYQHDTGVVG